MKHNPLTPAKLKITTHDTTLEALLTGAARLARFDTWPKVGPLELRDPFQDAIPCWQDIRSANDSSERLESMGHADGQIINVYRRSNRRQMR